MIKAFTRRGWHYEPRTELLRDGFGIMWDRWNIDAMRPAVSTRRYVPTNRPTRADVVRAFADCN